MIRVFVENLRVLNEGRMQGGWITLPNEDLDAAIEDSIGNREDDYIFTDYECDIGLNVLDYDVRELNDLLMFIDETDHLDLEESRDRAILKLLIEELSTLDDVEISISDGNFIVFHAKDMGEVAQSYIENTTNWSEFPETIRKHFNYDSYGEELYSTGTFLQDKKNNIILEVLKWYQ